MCACIPGPSPFQLHFSSLSKHYFSNLNPFLIRETITLSSDESGTDYLFRWHTNHWLSNEQIPPLQLLYTPMSVSHSFILSLLTPIYLDCVTLPGLQSLFSYTLRCVCFVIATSALRYLNFYMLAIHHCAYKESVSIYHATCCSFSFWDCRIFTTSTKDDQYHIINIDYRVRIDYRVCRPTKHW